MRYNLRRKTLELISKYGIKPKKRLSQNFLVNDFVVKNLLTFLNPQPTDVVLDIGAGLGLLTKLIARKTKKVIAIEIDPSLIRVLRDVTSDIDNVEVIESDIMELRLPSVDKIFSNVPYNISSPLILKLLRERCFKTAILTFQKEFALRMLAEPGTSHYGRLSVIVSLYGEVKKLMTIGRRSFYPPPKVDSIAIKLKPSGQNYMEVMDKVESLTAKLFSQRRRKLRKVLGKFYLKVPELPADLLDKRVYELTPLEILRLASLLSDDVSPNVATS